VGQLLVDSHSGPRTMDFFPAGNFYGVRDSLVISLHRRFGSHTGGHPSSSDQAFWSSAMVPFFFFFFFKLKSLERFPPPPTQSAARRGPRDNGRIKVALFGNDPRPLAFPLTETRFVPLLCSAAVFPLEPFFRRIPLRSDLGSRLTLPIPS